MDCFFYLVFMMSVFFLSRRLYEPVENDVVQSGRVSMIYRLVIEVCF